MLNKRVTAIANCDQALIGIAGLASLAAWVVGWVGFAFLFPLIWMSAKNRRTAFFVSMVYYMVGTWMLPHSTGVFFGTNRSVPMGVVLWLAAALMLSLVWTALWTPYQTNNRYPWRLLLSILILSIPPVGMVGWLSPLLSSAFFFPGWGMTSLLCIIGAWSLPIILRSKGKALCASLAAFGVLSVIANITYKIPKEPIGWVNFDTSAGKIPWDIQAQVQRQLDLIQSTKDILISSKNITLIVMPEQIAGYVDNPMLLVWQRELKFLPWHKGQMLMVGMERPIGNKGLYKDAVMFVYEGKIIGFASARQTVPVAMWRPWYAEHTPSDWFKTNLAPVPWNGKIKPAALTICYEELLVWPVVSTFMLEHPLAIVSVANDWWADPAERQVQREHIEAWSKIFGVPLIRAVNG